MSQIRDNGFAERRNLAATARQAQLEKFRASLAQDNPERLQREAERRAINEARAAREIEREVAREAARIAAELKLAAEKAEQEKIRLAEEEARLAEEAARLAARPSSFQEAAMYAARRAAGKGRR